METNLPVTALTPRHPLRAAIMPPPLLQVNPAATPPAPRTTQRAPLSDAAFFITSFISGFIIIFGMIA